MPISALCCASSVRATHCATSCTRAVEAPDSSHGPRARPPRLAQRATRHRHRADPALRPLDRLLLAGHAPADLQGAPPDGGRRLAHRRRRRVAEHRAPLHRDATGRDELAAWIAKATPPATMRSEVAVKMRGASYGDREALLAHLEQLVAEHQTRQAHFEQLEREQFPDPASLTGQQLDTWLVLRGGIKQEQFWVEWLSEYVARARSWFRDASSPRLLNHRGDDERLPPPAGADHDRRPHPAQPGGDGLDAHRPRGLRVGHPQAGGVLRRARPRRCRPDRHRRLRTHQARLAQAVRERPDLSAAVRAAQAGHRCRARGRRRDRAPGAARRPLRLHAVLAVRERPQVTDHPVPAERDVDQAGRPDGHRVRRVRRAGARGRGTTPSRSWAPRAT